MAKRNPDGRVFLALDPDAPDVPAGVRPNPGVEYGCGVQACRDCYEVIPPFVLRPGDVHDH
jgi:hypothetical protein